MFTLHFYAPFRTLLFSEAWLPCLLFFFFIAGCEGRPVVKCTWATICPFCYNRNTMPNLEQSDKEADLINSNFCCSKVALQQNKSYHCPLPRIIGLLWVNFCLLSIAKSFAVQVFKLAGQDCRCRMPKKSKELWSICKEQRSLESPIVRLATHTHRLFLFSLQAEYERNVIDSFTHIIQGGWTDLHLWLLPSNRWCSIWVDADTDRPAIFHLAPLIFQLKDVRQEWPIRRMLGRRHP